MLGQGPPDWKRARTAQRDLARFQNFDTIELGCSTGGDFVWSGLEVAHHPPELTLRRIPQAASACVIAERMSRKSGSSMRNTPKRNL